MPIAPKWETKDPNRVCWTCQHAQAWMYEDDQQDTLYGPGVECRERPNLMGDPVIIPPAFFSAFFDPDIRPQMFPVYIDGTKTWCNRWRQTNLPLPTPPALPAP